MAPSDSQHPEIGVREERGEEEKKAEKTKQNKHRGYFTPAAAGLGQTSHGGREGTRKSNRGRGTKKGNREGRKRFYNTEIIKQRNHCVVRKI